MSAAEKSLSPLEDVILRAIGSMPEEARLQYTLHRRLVKAVREYLTNDEAMVRVDDALHREHFDARCFGAAARVALHAALGDDK